MCLASTDPGFVGSAVRTVGPRPGRPGTVRTADPTKLKCRGRWAVPTLRHSSAGKHVGWAPPTVPGISIPSPLPLEVGPPALQIPQNSPEEAAVHPAVDAAALAGVVRVGLGVL